MLSEFFDLVRLVFHDNAAESVVQFWINSLSKQILLLAHFRLQISLFFDVALPLAIKSLRPQVQD